MQLDPLDALADRLSSRLAGLTRHDVPVAPTDSETERQIEFVVSPIGWTKISLTLSTPAARNAARAWVFVRLSFLPLYCPASDVTFLSVSPPRHGVMRAFLWVLPVLGHRWVLDPNRIDEAAAEIAHAADLRWPSALLRLGTAEGYAREYQYEAAQDVGWLETLAYSQVLTGDFEGARRSIGRLATQPDLGLEAASRVEQIDRLLTSAPKEVDEVLGHWRLERLRSEGLLALAGSQAEADAFEIDPEAVLRGRRPGAPLRKRTRA